MQGSILCNSALGRQMLSLRTFPAPSILLPQLYVLSTAPHGLGRSLGHWDQLSRLCPLPISCVPPACSLVGQVRSRKGPGTPEKLDWQENPAPCGILCFSHWKFSASSGTQETRRFFREMVKCGPHWMGELCRRKCFGIVREENKQHPWEDRKILGRRSSRNKTPREETKG